MAKIYILGPAHPFRGGLATYNERLARAFKEDGDEVLIHTFKLQYPSILFPGKTQYSSSPAPEDLEIIPSVNSIDPINWVKIGLRIKNEKPDMLIIRFWLPFMGPCFGTIARIVKKNKHTQVIALIDNIIPHEPRIGDKQLTKYFVNAMDGFIVQSRSVLEEMDIFDKEKPRIYQPHPLFDTFGDAIDKIAAKRALNIDIQNNYILFFGFIRGYKGFDILLQAMTDTRIQKQGLKLIVAGEYYEDPKYYQEYIKEHDLQDAVIMHTHFIPDEDIFKYFSACDMVVQPYKHATQSGVTQIAYHFNKPMLVTNVGGLPEIIPDGKVGYVTEPDPQQIADAIIDFYENDREEEFSANAAEEKKKFSWKVMVEKMKQLANL